MSSVNKVILLGHLGKEPELRYLEHDRMRASFTLATNESYKNKAGEKVTHTTWHNIVLWNALAKIAEQYLTKGKQVYLEGRLTTRAYVDKEGQTKYVTEVVGQQLVLLGSGRNGTEDAAVSPNTYSADKEQVADGLPF